MPPSLNANRFLQKNKWQELFISVWDCLADWRCVSQPIVVLNKKLKTYIKKVYCFRLTDALYHPLYILINILPLFNIIHYTILSKNNYFQAFLQNKDITDCHLSITLEHVAKYDFCIVQPSQSIKIYVG